MFVLTKQHCVNLLVEIFCLCVFSFVVYFE